VAEETARLVELLSGYTGAAASGSSSSDDSEPGGDGGASTDSGRRPDGEFAGSTGRAGECTCGGPPVCRICPLCQLISFVQRIDPDAIDRLAEVVELAATGLRDLATVQRGRRERDRPEPPDSA
jgi:hypothetical protein